MLALLRWPHDMQLLTIGTMAFAAALLGLVARRHRRPGWLPIDGSGMAVSDIALVTGF